MKVDDLRKKDLKAIWHPYTNMALLSEKDFPVIERAKGVFLYTADGKKLIDGIASWWCVNLGHGHPGLVSAIRRQAEQLQHVILGGMSHVPVIELADKLVQITPTGLEHVFFAGDGACSVEAALKVSLQYRANIGEKGRNRFISLEEGYHGDTLGAVGVGFVPHFHGAFTENIVPSYKAVSPHCAQCPYGKEPSVCDVECYDSMEEQIEKHHRKVTAVILEPLCQAAAGIRIYPAEYLNRLRKHCDEYGILLLADEIAVGLGRTGKMFAVNHAGISPDILCLGKGLTGGYLPMSAMLVTDEIYSSFVDRDDPEKTFYHGHTFGGNPITSAVALEALSIYEKEGYAERAGLLEEKLKAAFRQISRSLSDSYYSVLGMIAMIEIDEKAGGLRRAEEITKLALSNGLFLRPLGPVIYLWPPLSITEKELDEALNILGDAVRQTSIK
jgi:adenosylmethionine-8-amino-7-oxononanoate aminotransferase